MGSPRLERRACTQRTGVKATSVAACGASEPPAATAARAVSEESGGGGACASGSVSCAAARASRFRRSASIVRLISRGLRLRPLAKPRRLCAERGRQLRVRVAASSERRGRTPSAQRVPRRCRRSLQRWLRGVRSARRSAARRLSRGAQHAPQRRSGRHRAAAHASRTRTTGASRARSGERGWRHVRTRPPLSPLRFSCFSAPWGLYSHPRASSGAAVGAMDEDERLARELEGQQRERPARVRKATQTKTPAAERKRKAAPKAAAASAEREVAPQVRALCSAARVTSRLTRHHAWLAVLRRACARLSASGERRSARAARRCACGRGRRRRC